MFWLVLCEYNKYKVKEEQLANVFKAIRFLICIKNYILNWSLNKLKIGTR